MKIDRIVVLCRFLPDPRKSSGELRFWQILRHLAGRSRKLTVLAEAGAASCAGFTARPMTELPAARGADLAFLEFWFMDRYLPGLRRLGIPVVLDSVDVEFLRRAREKKVLAIKGRYHHLEKAREIAAYRAADQVWAVSEEDARRIRPLCRSVVVVPNVFAVKQRVPRFPRRDGVCFVGSYSHQPNVDGLRWYRDAIWPRLRGLRHVIVGNDAPPDIAALPGFLGGVPRSSVHVARARVSVAPLRYGAGLKGKVLEAMACGTPVVTTPIGDEGYGAGRAGAAIVTDDPREFAAAVRRLAEDETLWRRMSRCGREHAAQFAPAAVGETIDAALDAVLASRRSRARGASAR